MDLADALAKRHIKLVLYFGCNIGIEDWRKAWGSDLSRWPTQLARFLQEIGNRYGTKVSGLFFDGGYESLLYPNDFDFETVTKAAKTGKPNRVVSYNNWIFPEITPFQDY